MSQTLKLPDHIYDALLRAASAVGTTPESWIAERLPNGRQEVTREDREAANARLRQCIVSLGHPTGIDNESIDADLAREYGEDHKKLYER